MNKQGKIVVLSAPSGCGKSTIIGRLLQEPDALPLQFSVSATNRQPRQGEVDGVNYHFLSTDDFRDAVQAGDFIEWEEVYPGRYYGTLRREIDSKIAAGYNVVLDIDVKGALNVKRIYGDQALTLFIQPPSVDELRRRLEARATDAPDVIDQRVGKAEYELSFAPQFDASVVNDDLDRAVEDARNIINNHLYR
ncbi:MAG: guanylate kinase [Bacteroides sp.]|nr:guanylate kinase [Bacteroides sp.]MDE6042885.1 guanylate kinase [Muribaculaceae bacterium]